ADEVGGWHFEVLNKEFGGVVIQHGLNRANLDLASLDGLTQVDQKHAEPTSLVGELVVRGCARQEQQQVRMLSPRSPVLLPIDDVTIALANARRFEAGRLRTRVGFRHTKRL